MFTTKPIGLDRKLFKTIDKNVEQILADNMYLRLVERERRRSSFSGATPLDGPHRNSWLNRQYLCSESPLVFSDHADIVNLVNVPEHAYSLSVETTVVADDSGEMDELPFGPLKNVTTRKTFAYLVAILNSTYPDHDFSNLQPSVENFHRIPRAETFVKRFNNLMISLGKKEDTLNWIWDTINSYMDMVTLRASATSLKNEVPTNFTQTQSFARLESTSSQIMTSASTCSLLEAAFEPCQIYQFQPSDESILQDLSHPYQTMWSYYWFIYNKKKKRVSFIFLRAINKLHFSRVNSTRTLHRHDGAGGVGKGMDLSDDDADNVQIDSDEYLNTNDVVGDLEI